MSRLPLPPADHAYNSGSFAPLWGEKKMHAYADASNAALRSELIRAANFELDVCRLVRHEQILNNFEDLFALAAEREALERRVIKTDASNAALIEQVCVLREQLTAQDAHEAGLAEAQAYLMARVRVLEDALRGMLAGEDVACTLEAYAAASNAARAALMDVTEP